jgi:hypothetical protein
LILSRHAVLATLTTAGLLMAGCGGDDSSDKLSKADLAKQADTICVKYNAKVKAVAEPTDIASFGPYLDKLLPFSEAQRAELVKLTPEDSVKAEWDGLIKDYDEQQKGIEDAQAALKGGDETEFQRIVEDTGTLGETSDKKLDAFGAPHCGSKSSE